MHRCAEPRLTATVGAAAASIFSSARARPSGFRVSSAPDASARYSRRRDTIIASSCASSGASRIAISHTTKRMIPATPLPRSSPRSRRRAPPPHIIPRRAQSASSATAPTSAATIVITRTSRLRMWLISWATTPCSSSRSSVSSRPRVTASDACSGSRPVANAFGSASGTTYTCGRGSPAAIAISSTTFWSWWSVSLSASAAAASSSSTGRAAVASSTARSPEK